MRGLRSLQLLYSSRSAFRSCSSGAAAWRGYASSASSASSDVEEFVFIDPKLVLARAGSSLGDGSSSQSGLEDLVAQGKACSVTLPSCWLVRLGTEARQELGEMDDPLNAWVWGRAAEMFEFTLVGSHSSQSGFTSVLRRADLEAAFATHRPPASPSHPPPTTTINNSISDKSSGLGDVSGSKGSRAGVSPASSRGLPAPSSGLSAPVALPSWEDFCAAVAGREALRGGSAMDIRPLLFAGRIVESNAAAVYVLRGSDPGAGVEGLLVSSESASNEPEE